MRRAGDPPLSKNAVNSLPSAISEKDGRLASKLTADRFRKDHASTVCLAGMSTLGTL